MNILMLVGSPRRDGNCDTLTRHAAEAAREAGAEVDVVHLGELDIGPCEACNTCRREPKRCHKEDGMQQLYPKLRWADALLISSPVYWWGPSAQVKLFVDRWYAIDDRREVFGGKPLSLISASGSSSPNMADNVFGPFKSIAAYLGMTLLGTLWVGGDARQAAGSPRNIERAREMGRLLAAKARRRAEG